MTFITTLPGSSGNENVPRVPTTDAEDALFAVLEPYRAAKAGIYIDCMHGLQYRNAAAGDAPSGFELLDLLGGRRFRVGLGAGTVGAGRHPWITTDDVTGQPALMFGAGGSGGNAISFGSDLEKPSMIVGGEEANRLPLFNPATGFTMAAALRVPTPSTTVNGQLWPATTGGVVLGSCAASPRSPSLEVIYGSGNARMRPRQDAGPTTAVADSANHANSQWLRLVATYNASLNRGRIWVNGAAYIETTSMAQIYGDDAAGLLPRIGGIGATALASRYIGILGTLICVPAPIAEDSATRALFDARLIERTTA
ncbi:MAG: hypothetical protein JHD35_16345 [Sphingopyxis sp.]|nr:hypothetical protein [Sphingopyxis sp.]